TKFVFVFVFCAFCSGFCANRLERIDERRNKKGPKVDVGGRRWKHVVADRDDEGTLTARALFCFCILRILYWVLWGWTRERERTDERRTKKASRVDAGRRR
ncbi:hypothetical protein B0H21DRAFT_738057, partial [Amylocystis lapponica]